MGITATLYKLTEMEYNSLPDDPFESIGILIPADLHTNPEFYDLQKEWSMLHYLLCGASEPDGSLLSDAVLGGLETKIEMDYGPVRYRSPQHVADISNALTAVDLDSEFENRDMSSEALENIYLADVFLEEGIDSVKRVLPRFHGLIS